MSNASQKVDAKRVTKGEPKPEKKLEIKKVEGTLTDVCSFLASLFANSF